MNPGVRKLSNLPIAECPEIRLDSRAAQPVPKTGKNTMKSIYCRPGSIEPPQNALLRLLSAKYGCGVDSDRAFILADPIHPVNVWLVRNAELNPQEATWRDVLVADWLAFWRDFEDGQWFDMVAESISPNKLIRALRTISEVDGVPRLHSVRTVKAWNASTKRAEYQLRGIRLTRSIY